MVVGMVSRRLRRGFVTAARPSEHFHSERIRSGELARTDPAQAHAPGGHVLVRHVVAHGA
jgi:hypothetical protein